MLRKGDVVSAFRTHLSNICCACLFIYCWFLSVRISYLVHTCRHKQRERKGRQNQVNSSVEPTSRCLQLNCQCSTGLKPALCQPGLSLFAQQELSLQSLGARNTGPCSLKTWRKQTFVGSLGEDWEIQEEYRKKKECDNPVGFRGLRLKPDQQQEEEFCIPQETHFEAWAYTSSCPGGKVKCRK